MDKHLAIIREYVLKIESVQMFRSHNQSKFELNLLIGLGKVSIRCKNKKPKEAILKILT